MPRCFIAGCRHSQTSYTNRQHFTLHVFPKSPNRIRRWLEATGKHFENIDETIQLIITKRKQSTYRMCSAHFENSAYHVVGVSKHLKPDAVPSIFDSQPSTAEHSVNVNVLPSITPANTDTDMNVPGTASTTLSLGVIEERATCIMRPSKRMRFSDHDYTPAVAGFCFNDYVSAGTNTERICFGDESIKAKPMGKMWHRSRQTQTTRYFGKRTKSVSTWDLLFKRDASTWTGDNVFEDVSSEEDIRMEVQTSTPIQAMSGVLRKGNEHTFISPITKARMLPHDQDASPTISSTDTVLDDRQDPTYEPDSDMSMDQSTIIAEPTVLDIVSDSKFLVFQSCLDQLLNLLTVCTHNGSCGSPLIEKTKSVCGTLLIVYGTCENEHKLELWRSQPMLGSKPAGNVLWSAAVLFSGSNFTKAHEMFQILGVPCIGKTTHYINQTNYLFPVIDMHYDHEHQAIIEKLKDQMLCVSGDGQCDSPGHNARYCAYSVMEENTKKIIESEVVEVTETTSSNAMEKLGFVRCVDRMLENGLEIGIIATDRHISIRSVMEKKYSGIRHEFDIWHYAKSLNKRLVALCKRKNCRELGPWRTAIVLHLWTSTCTSRGNVELLREQWNSILRHVTNEHYWEDGVLVHGCNHVELDDENEREREWLDKDSFAYGQLSRLVLDKQTQKDLNHMAHFCHTGELEVFNSTVLRHRSKRTHFTKDGMIARTRLAVLAHNNNVNRPKAVIKKKTKKSGELGEVRYEPFFSKKTKTWKVKVVYEKCQIHHVYKLMFDVGRKLTGEIDYPWVSKSKNQPKTVARIPRPPKEELVLGHLPRIHASSRQ